MLATIRHNSVDINSFGLAHSISRIISSSANAKHIAQNASLRTQTQKQRNHHPSSHFLYRTQKSYSSCSILSNCLSTTINRSLILCCSSRNRALTCSLLSPGPNVGSILVSMDEREARLAPMRSSSATGLSRSWSRSLSTSPECGRLRLWYVKSTGGGPYVWYCGSRTWEGLVS